MAGEVDKNSTAVNAPVQTLANCQGGLISFNWANLFILVTFYLDSEKVGYFVV